MTDQELKDIVAAVVAELEKSGVDFDYKIEAPLDTDTIFVIRGTAPNYQGVTVTWKGLLDIITAQATQAKNDAETAKNAADTILSQVTTKESNVSTMKSEVSEMKTSVESTKSQVEGMKNAVETTKGQVETMKTSVETSKSQVEANKSQVETMKTSIETTKSEVEILKSESETAKETATQKAAETTQAKGDVESMKASVEKTVADFNALAEEKKLEVQGVYQNDLNELKGDLIDIIKDVYTSVSDTGSLIMYNDKRLFASVTANGSVDILHTGKNLLAKPYTSNTQTTNGITYTYNSDGSIKSDGTATANTSFQLVSDATRRPIKKGTYTFSGCPKGGSNTTYRMIIGITGVREFNDDGDGITVNIESDTTFYMRFTVYSGTTVDFTVYPQIEYGSAKTEWNPYKAETITVESNTVEVNMFNGVNIFNADSEFTINSMVNKGDYSIINLLNYGLKGDGTTDDTEMIQKALDDAENRILVIPKGVFIFSRTLRVHTGTKIIGCGENSVLQLADDFTLDDIEWRPNTYNALYKYPMIALDEGSTGCELRNFALVGQNINWKDENEDGIMVKGSNHVIENLVIHNINYSNDNFASRWCLCPAWGINIFKANTVSVRNCHIYDCGYENIGTEESENITISDCRFGDACQTSSQIHRYSKHIKFYSNSVYHTENIRSSNCPAFTCDASIGVDMDDILVANNTFLSHVNTVAGGENNIRFIGNRIVGIMYTNTTDNYASGLIISDNQIEGRINMRADNVIVSNNIINNDTEMPMAIIYGNNVEMNGNLGIGIGKSTAIVEH